MYTLKFKVQNKELKIISEDDKKESFIKGSFNIDKLEFEFSEEWDDLSKKVIYKVGDKSYVEAVIDNEAIVPKEVYASAGFIEISVVGFANENGKDTVVLPTNTVRKLIYDTNSNGEDPANLPDESSWNEYQKKIEDLAEEAKKAEANAKTSAASAENVKNEVEKSVDGFDENVEKKTAEFNKNAEEKTAEFNKNTEQLYKDIESLESLAPLSTEAGTTINVDNAKAYKMMGYVVDGKYQQETTTGKNAVSSLFETVSAGSSYISYNINANILKKTMTYSFTPNFSDTAVDVYIRTKSGSSVYKKARDLTLTTNKKTVVNFTLTDEEITNLKTTESIIQVYRAYSTWENPTLKEPQLESGSTATSYEPYTGGQSAPNPEYAKEITQVSSVALNRCGKNMANPRGVSWTYNGITIEKLGEDRFRLNGTATGAFDYAIFGNRKIYLTKDKYYKLSRIVWSGTTTGTGISNCRLITPTTSAWAWLQSSLPTAKKAPEDSYIDLIVLAIGKNVTFTNYVFSVQLEEVENADSPATSYEAYNSQSINIDLDGNEICALSDTIKDQLIIDKNGNVVLQKNVAKLVLDGNSYWKIHSVNNCFSHPVGFVMNKRSVNSISNIFREKDPALITNNANFGMYTKFTNALLIGYPNITLEEFKTFLNNNNLILYHCMNEPQIIELPKLAEIPTMLDGINHIWFETNIGLTNIEIKYVEDLQREIEKLKTAIVALGGV